MDAFIQAKVHLQNHFQFGSKQKKINSKFIRKLLKLFLSHRDGCFCRYCGKKLNINAITFDHHTPWVSGGINSLTNIVISCRKCNNTKSTFYAIKLPRKPQDTVFELKPRWLGRIKKVKVYSNYESHYNRIEGIRKSLLKDKSPS